MATKMKGKMTMKQYEKSPMDKKADARELKAVNKKMAKKGGKGMPMKGMKRG